MVITMFEIGLSICENEINENVFKQYQEVGIKNMEISTDRLEYDNMNFEQLKNWANKYNVCLWSFHLPFSPFSEIDISNPALCKSTISHYTEFIKKGSSIGIKKYIVHPSGEPIGESEYREKFDCAKESLFTLAEIAKSYSAEIAVENLPRTCLGKNSDEIAELINVNENLKVCFDTNHLLNEDICSFIHKIGDKIITTHVSDFDYIDEKHWMPGEGDIDWQKLLHALKEINYKGVWLYEVGFDNPKKPLVRERNLTYSDFVKNSVELFENKPITIIPSTKEIM